MHAHMSRLLTHALPLYPSIAHAASVTHISTSCLYLQFCAAFILPVHSCDRSDESDQAYPSSASHMRDASFPHFTPCLSRTLLFLTPSLPLSPSVSVSVSLPLSLCLSPSLTIFISLSPRLSRDVLLGRDASAGSTTVATPQQQTSAGPAAAIARRPSLQHYVAALRCLVAQAQQRILDSMSGGGREGGGAVGQPDPSCSDRVSNASLGS